MHTIKSSPILLLALLLSCSQSNTGAGSSEQGQAADNSQAGQTELSEAAAGVAPGTLDSVNIALARKQGRTQAFEWMSWSKAAFDRARAEGRYILLHGAAVWCHWCHVMEETTYLDPTIGRILKERFIAIRVDVDSRPDIAERYEDWGWPATILFSPEAEEIGKYRGYIAPDDMRDILTAVEDQALHTDNRAEREPGPQSASLDGLGWIGDSVTIDLDEVYDRKQGSWGWPQKVPLGPEAEFEVRRASRGDDQAKQRAVFTLAQHAKLIDPVWGGIYQYSTDRGWVDPHFEKLMTYQASNIEAYASAYANLGDKAYLDHADDIASYVAKFLTSPEGAFYVTQDADVGTHDKSQKFVDGNVYYRKNEQERLALGIPWVDDHVYGYENGLMISALVSLYQASDDKRYLDRATRAADVMLASHLEKTGAVLHDAKSASTVRFLADSAGLGRALARLAAVTKDSRYKAAARRIADYMLDALWNDKTRAFIAHTPDPNAAGVFTRPRHPFAHNVTAARFLTELAKLTGDKAMRERAHQTLAAISTPAALDAQGRMVGTYLLALDEAGLYRWKR